MIEALLNITVRPANYIYHTNSQSSLRQRALTRLKSQRPVTLNVQARVKAVRSLFSLNKAPLLVMVNGEYGNAKLQLSGKSQQLIIKTCSTVLISLIK